MIALNITGSSNFNFIIITKMYIAKIEHLFYYKIRTFVLIGNGGNMKKKDCLFVVMTMLLVLLIFFCTTETVISQSRDGSRKQYYADMEKRYLSDIKMTLCEKGYSNSGITIRWVSDSEGLRIYTVLIHHRKIESLDNNEKKELIHDLSVTEFEDESCTFSYEFITT